MNAATSPQARAETPAGRRLLRRLNRGAILADAEVVFLVRRTLKVMPIVAELGGADGLGESIRFGAVQRRLARARLQRGLDVQAAAAAIGIPQSSVKAAEQRLAHLELRRLEKHIAFLGLDVWFRRWRRANRRLVA